MSEMPLINSVSGDKTLYFESREQAGKLLAEKLLKYKNEITTVLTLSNGSLLVGAEIAKSLHSSIAMLMTKDIYLPDGRTIVGVINETGGYVYNNYFSASEIEEFESEYRSNIEQAKMQALHEIHVALGRNGIITPQYFRNHVVIVVADASFNGMAFDMAYNYIKTIKYKRLIMVAPILSIKAIDKMHVIADELQCLSVTAADVFNVDHYYANNTMPNQTEIAKILNDTILNWNNPRPTTIKGARTYKRNMY